MIHPQARQKVGRSVDQSSAFALPINPQFLTCVVPGFKFPAWQRLTEKETLGVVASQVYKGLQVLPVLEPLGDNLNTQIMTERNDRSNYALTTFIGDHASHQALIDLHFIDREHVELGERGVSGSEVVDGDPDP